MPKIEVEFVIKGADTLEGQTGKIKQQSRSAQEDLDRLGKTSKELGNSFRDFGLIATGALGGIAAISPSLAGPLSELEVELFGIADTLGKSLKPAFDGFVDGVHGIGQFLNQHKWAADLTSDLLILGTAVAVGGPLLKGLGSVLESVTGLKIIANAGGILIPIALSLIIPKLLGDIFAGAANPEQEAAIKKNTEVFGPFQAPIEEGGVGLARMTNAFREPATEAALSMPMVRSSLEILGNILAGVEGRDAPYSGEDIVKAQLDPTGYGEKLFDLGRTIVIQILDGNGQTRDTLTVG